MKEIADETVVEKFGIAIRLVKDSGTFIVQQAPVDQEGKYNENDFEVFGGTVGYDSSEFVNEDGERWGFKGFNFYNPLSLLFQ